MKKCNKNVTGKLRTIIFVIKQLREIIKYKNIRTIYSTLLESPITYGIIGSGGAYDSTLSKLQNFQNTIVKVANKKKLKISY
jgi:hypothetical protein